MNMPILHNMPDDSQDPRPVLLDDEERRWAKLDLIAIVDQLGVVETRQLLPKLGMVEHYGLPTVTRWLDNIAKGAAH